MRNCHACGQQLPKATLKEVALDLRKSLFWAQRRRDCGTRHSADPILLLAATSIMDGKDDTWLRQVARACKAVRLLTGER